MPFAAVYLQLVVAVQSALRQSCLKEEPPEMDVSKIGLDLSAN